MNLNRAFIFGILLIALALLADWALDRRAPIATSTERANSAAESPAPRTENQRQRSVARAAAPAPKPTSSPREIVELAPEDRYLPVARVACQSEVLSAFAKSPDSCTSEVLGLEKVIETRMEALKKGGIQIDLDRCVVTDPNGETTDLDSIGKDLVWAAQKVLVDKLTFDKGFPGYEFKRANMVAVCSVFKVMQYWANHPDEIPPPDRIEDFLYFDVQTGKPRESFITATFLRAMAAVSPRAK